MNTVAFEHRWQIAAGIFAILSTWIAMLVILRFQSSCDISEYWFHLAAALPFFRYGAFQLYHGAGCTLSPVIIWFPVFHGCWVACTFGLFGLFKARTAELKARGGWKIDIVPGAALLVFVYVFDAMCGFPVIRFLLQPTDAWGWRNDLFWLVAFYCLVISGMMMPFKISGRSRESRPASLPHGAVRPGDSRLSQPRP